MPDRTGQPAVVVAGDALVDLTSRRTATGSVVYEPHPGGSCLNVAAGLGRLAVPTVMLARISRDGFGRFLRAHLAASGVGDAFLLPTDDLTTLAVADIDGGEAGYSFHAEKAADRGLVPADLALLPGGGALPPGAALHVGSIALVQEPQASTLDGLMRRESGRRLLSLDPNVRPGLVQDPDAYRERMAAWIRLCDVVKVSDEDLRWLCPGRAAEDVVAEWLADGAGLVVVTRGPGGAWVVSGSAERSVPAPSVTVRDTVGAGDAFMAMLLAQLYWRGRLSRDAVRTLDGDETGRILEAAVWAGADTCTRSGAQPPGIGEMPERFLSLPRAAR